MKLKEIADYVEAHLRVREIPDSSLNGVQVENSGEVRKIASAVDISLETVRRAAEAGADLILVHHGLFWKQPIAAAGRYYPIFKTLFDHNIALIAEHLPLDVHSELGNNALIAKVLGLKTGPVFGSPGGMAIIQSGTYDAPVSVETFLATFEKAVGKPLAFTSNGKKTVSKIGIVSGGGNFAVEEAARAGCDLFVTGDASHTVYHPARELGISVLAGGHYATEVFGVRALGEHLSKKFGLSAEFLDIPTGL
ncbi:MAG: Nif3-like dinuclear metal center hexameric protein [Spirochaetia bacterium]|nr:Nif3-like dinuclear metal center hexameric protein [Spirochaetia bacterium]